MNSNASTNTIVDSSEDTNGIAVEHPNYNFNNHMETNADMHTGTDDPNQLAWDGSLNALYGGPYQQNSISVMDAINAQRIQTIKLTVMVDSSDANQVAHSGLRTHVHRAHTPTEQSLPKSEVTIPFETSPCNIPSDFNVMSTQPHLKKRRTGHRNSSNATPTGCLSTFTVSEDRTLLASTSTVDNEFACPKCNMGDGHAIRPYTRKGDTSADKIDSAETANSNQETKPPKVFKNTACFDRHVVAAHKRDFKSSDSSEYICRYCPCGIFDGHLACAARFEENDFDGLLQHLRESHARPSLQYRNNPHDHWCASLAKSFQLQSLHDFANDPSEPFFGL